MSFAATRGVYLTDLYVEPAHRRRGVARALMTAVARRCREHGGQWVVWDVWGKKVPALAFYEQLGARPRAGLLSHVAAGRGVRAAGRAWDLGPVTILEPPTLARALLERAHHEARVQLPKKGAS